MNGGGGNPAAVHVLKEPAVPAGQITGTIRRWQEKEMRDPAHLRNERALRLQAHW
jgi:hypothetical protein